MCSANKQDSDLQTSMASVLKRQKLCTASMFVFAFCVILRHRSEHVSVGGCLAWNFMIVPRY